MTVKRIVRSRLANLPRFTLRAPTPCCKRPVRLVALDDLSLEKYDRTCAGCGFSWTITRTPLRRTAQLRMDKLEWEMAR